MAKACRTCGGRGRWNERVENDSGYIGYQSKYCNDCKGTGIEQDPEEGDDFDIGGSSYEDDD